MMTKAKKIRHGTDRSQVTAIIGMGKTGQSVARFLLHQHQACEAFDEHLEKLPEDLNIPLHTGPLRAEILARYGHIVVSPGICWQHPALVAAREQGVPMHGDLDLFCTHYQGSIIAVTGTNGKTTTATLIHTLLDILPGGIEAGGNIGTPMLDLLQHNPPKVVLELSSFQLERSSHIHPEWAVLLNVQPDHADMHASQEDYRAAKLRLFSLQGKGDTAMLPAEAQWHDLAGELASRGVKLRRFGPSTEKNTDLEAGILLHADGTSEIFWTQQGSKHHVPTHTLVVRGSHQHLNMSVAAQAAADYGVSLPVIREALTSFRGLPHRLEWVGNFCMRDWYNDSKATNPAAAKAALESFDRVIWICGGLRKKLDLAPLRSSVAHHVAQAFIIGQDPKPFLDLMASAKVPAMVAGTMENAVRLAAAMDNPLPVLLSPAAASMDQFRNYAERGKAFAHAVRTLEKAA